MNRQISSRTRFLKLASPLPGRSASVSRRDNRAKGKASATQRAFQKVEDEKERRHAPGSVSEFSKDLANVLFILPTDIKCFEIGNTYFLPNEPVFAR